MNSKIVSIILVLVLLIGGLFFFRGETSAPSDLNDENNGAAGTVLEGSEGANYADTPGLDIGMLKEFTVDAKNFSFSPSTMTVNEGDTVRITLTSSGGTHDLKIDEFGVATKVLQSGGTDTIEFVATQTGSFEYYCSIGNHRQMGMVGTLIVE